MRRRISIVTMLAVLACGAASVMYAQQPPAGPPDGGPQGRGRAMRGGPGGTPGAPVERLLGLNDDQRAKFNAIMRGVNDQSAPVADELAFTRRSLTRETFADRRDDAKIASLSAKVVSLEKQLLDIRVKGSGTLSDALTPEQRQTLRLHGDAFPAPGGPRGGRGRGGE